MRLLKILIPAGALVLMAAPAHAQSAALSGALEESGEAAAAGLEAGVKVVSGVVALPIASVGVGSAAVGTLAESAGELAVAVGTETVEAGEAALLYANEPLSVDDGIVVGPAPAPAPSVPRDAQRQ